MLQVEGLTLKWLTLKVANLHLFINSINKTKISCLKVGFAPKMISTTLSVYTHLSSLSAMLYFGIQFLV